MAIRARKQGFSRKHETESSPRRHGSRNGRRKVEPLPKMKPPPISVPRREISNAQAKKNKQQHDRFTENSTSEVAPVCGSPSFEASRPRACRRIAFLRAPVGGFVVSHHYYSPAPQTLEGASRRACPSPERDINLANLRGLPACEKLFLFLPADTASKRILRGFAAPRLVPESTRIRNLSKVSPACLPDLGRLFCAFSMANWGGGRKKGGKNAFKKKLAGTC